MNPFRLVTILLILFSACSFFPIHPAEPTLPQTVPPTLPAEPTQPQRGTVTPATSAPVSFLGLPWEDAAMYAPGLVKSQQEQFSSLRGGTVYHLALTISDDLVHIKGREEVRYTNREKDALDKVKFRLFPNLIGGEMTISNLTLDGQPAQPAYELAGSVLVAPLPKAIRPGEGIVIGMDYQLSVPTDSETNYGVLASVGGVLALAHAYPMIPVYDESGWNVEIPSPSGDLTFADASYYAVRVTAPASLMLIASGRQVSLEKALSTQTVLFALGPGRDFVLAAVKGYEVVSATSGGITVNSYAPANDREGARAALETASKAIELFSERYAPYPYTEFDVVATPTLALGVEYPGFIAINVELYKPDSGQFSAPVNIMLESTLAHEVGHQWFYNLIGNDQLDQPWLDESLTQFATWQYFADRYGLPAADGFKQSLESRWERVDKEKIPVGKPVAAYGGKEYSAIVYGRGAFFFFALRDQIGQEKFDAFLKDYSQHYTWDVSTTDGLKSLAETDCGCDLDALFKEWIIP